MEESVEESLDGSSIKPVSSLRSQFEQMSKTNSNPTSTPRAVSPKPQSPLVRAGDSVKSFPGIQDSTKIFGENQYTRGRKEAPVDTGGLHPRRISSNTNVSPSPTRGFRPKPTVSVPPEVTIQPPLSPPKGKSLNLNLSNAAAYLSAETPTSASSGGSSPRHFRIPSRPHTPLLEHGKPSGFPKSQPPSPPPPRRSGEFRRDSATTLPPPINRADKPKIGSKSMALGPIYGAVALEPGPPRASLEKSSPFSTPPGSDRSTPEHEVAQPVAPPRPKPRNIPDTTAVTANPQMAFEPPPAHHTVVSKRKDQELNGAGRGRISPQSTGEQRPALPTRPQTTFEAQKRMLPPPPPRPSIDRKRPNLSAEISTEAIPIASNPKRISSVPITQAQTPPRTHGRSNTVGKFSDRAPAEFRASLESTTHQESVAPSTSYIAQTLNSDKSEYPDTFNANRRLPVHKQGVREISCKGDLPRFLDVCGEFVCVAGSKSTRVWSLLNGEQIMCIPHAEGVKTISIAFKPVADPHDEGCILWLGNNIGDIVEIDIASQSEMAVMNSAHTRRDVTQMLKYMNEIWTFDDSGTFHVWGPDKSYREPSRSFRVPKGQSFSMVVGDELWHATGKDIRVFIPTGSVQFQVLARPFGQPNAGEIISGATIRSQPDRVYFGHTDGKVSIYTRDYRFVGLVSISVYKITSLVGVGDYLWASFSTGIILVYDTTQTPWMVKKYWRAHNDPIVRMTGDLSSCWTLGRSHVVSLGQDNMIRIWDGLLQDDWIENQMRSKEAEFCAFQPLNALVMTWNAGASTPFNLQHSDRDASFFQNLFQNTDRPDILVFGFQELVDLEDKSRTAKSFFKSKKKDPNTDQEHMGHQYRNWRDHLAKCLDSYYPHEIYHLLHSASLVGLFTCIFVRSPLGERIRNVSAQEIKRGMGGVYGNKGSLVIRFLIDDTSICLFNCHLAAGQSQTKDRNTDITAILDATIFPAERDQIARQDSYVSGGDGMMIMDHEICILNGDLNYRIDTMGRDTVVNAIKSNNLSRLLERDQLLASKRKNPWFKLRAFDELPITFAPTYKYDVGTDRYDTSEKKRAPAWCDRILYRGGDRIKQFDYQRHELWLSDHRPVTGLFEITTKTIDPQRREQAWEECRKALADMKEKHGKDEMLYYLTYIAGFDAATSSNLIREKAKN